MGKVKLLTPQVANLIAAGEVVGRPASVVKELVENALDAGASSVQVVVTDAGRTLIQVIDDGSGMSPEDASMCFERHATSKISTPEDLENIMSFGFRGEALASIAAVAQVCLRTRREEDEVGVQVDVEAGQLKSKACSTAKGTNITVRNLFFNTPARRKFLKGDGVELKHVIEEFEHVALTRPDVAFSLRAGERDIFVLKKAKSLKFRIQDIFGSALADSLVDVGADTSIVSLSGFIGRPEGARKTPGAQFFFVNGRYFRSPYLHKAVMNAYAQLISEGSVPSYFIYLSTDTQNVDVNISPTKNEVKFENDSVIFQTVYACVREALGRNSFGAAIDFDSAGSVQMPQLGRSFSEYRGGDIRPSNDFNPDYNPFEQSDFAGQAAHPSAYGGGQDKGRSYGTDWPRPQREDYSALFEGTQLPTVQKEILLCGKYILTPVSSGILIVNARRACIRILYERLLSSLQNGEIVGGTMLFPIEVNVGAQHVPVFEQKQDLLHSLGFDIRPFSADSVAVSGIPQGIDSSEESVRTLLQQLPILLEEEGGSGSLSELMYSRLAGKLAESEAISYALPTNSREAAQLLDKLFACSNADLTPSGKRTTRILSIDDLDKLF